MVALLFRKPPTGEVVQSPDKFCFLQVYRCSLFHMSGRRSHIPHFLIGSFNLSLRGSQRTVQTNIHTLIRYLHCK